MNKTEAKRILKKKRPTGEELGRLYVANEDRRLKTVGGEGLYKEDEYLDAVGKITGRADSDSLEFYVYAADILERLNHERMKFEAGFIDGVNQMLVRLHVIYNAETAEYQANLTPLTMTESEYQTLYEEAERHRKNTKVSLEGVVIAVITSALNGLDTGLPGEVLKALDKLKTEAVKEKGLIKAYKTGTFDGIYKVHSTGEMLSRSELTDYLQGWRISKTSSKPFHDLARLFFHGAKACKEAFKDHPILKHATEEPALFLDVLEDYLTFRDISSVSNMIEHSLDEILSEGAKISSFVQRPKRTVTKHDILSAMFQTEQHTPGTMARYFYNMDSAAEALQKHYPDIWETLSDHVKSVHPSKYYTVGTLADAGLTIYKEASYPFPEDFAECYKSDYWGYKSRILNSGIAVIKPESQSVNDRRYMDKLTPAVFSLYRGILHIDEAEKETIAKAHEYITNGAKRLFDYDLTFETLTELFGTPTLLWSKRGDKVREKIFDVNASLYISFLNMEGDRATKGIKRARFKEVFRDFDLSKLTPPADIATEGKKRLFELKAKSIKEGIEDEIDHFINNLYSGRNT